MKTTHPVIPIYTLVISWVLILPLLLFASQGGFSFEQGSINTLAGYAASGLTTSSEQSLGLRVQRIALYLICASVMLFSVRSILNEFRYNKLLLAILFLAFASAAWSQNSLATLQSASLLTIDLGFSVFLLKRFSRNDLLQLMIIVGAVAAALSLFLVIAFPEYGLQGKKVEAFGAWQGIFTHKNACGSALTMLLLPVFFVQTKSRYGWMFRWVYSFILLFMIAMTKSVGAYVVCVLCLVFVAAIKSLAKMSQKSAFVSIILLSAVVICVAYLVFENSGATLMFLGKDPTMTGRTVIWTLLLPSILKRPLLGYGYMAFWQGGLRGESSNVAIALRWPGISYSENGMIDLWLGLGAIAVVLFLLLFGRATRDALYCFKRDASQIVMWYTMILFTTVVSNIAAGRILYPTSLECILQIVAFVGLAEERRRIRAMFSAEDTR